MLKLNLRLLITYAPLMFIWLRPEQTRPAACRLNSVAGLASVGCQTEGWTLPTGDWRLRQHQKQQPQLKKFHLT